MVLGIQSKKSDQSVEYFPRHMIVQGQCIEQKYKKMIELQIKEAKFQPGTKGLAALFERRTRRFLSLVYGAKKKTIRYRTILS